MGLDGLASDRVEDRDELSEGACQLLTFRGAEALDRWGEVDAGPTLGPRFGFDSRPDRLFEKREFIRHVFEQASVAVWITSLKVQRQLGAATCVVQPQLEVDIRFVAEQFD